MAKIGRIQKQATKLKILLIGASGSGKTYSALQLAKGITCGDLSKSCFIDTEKGVNIYADADEQKNPFLFQLDRYSAQDYITDIKDALTEKPEVLIIDSLTPAWSGRHGFLEINNELAVGRFKGNTFSAWGETRKEMAELHSWIFTGSSHVICTARSKTDYVVDYVGGKNTIKKVGTTIDYKDTLEYEFDVVFNVDSNHYATASKDRTKLFNYDECFMINEDTGKKLLLHATTGASNIKSEFLELISKAENTHLIKEDEATNFRSKISSMDEEKMQKGISYLTSLFV